MQLPDNPWDALDVLEGYCASDFWPRWRAFVSECTALLAPRLVEDVRAWIAVADGVDQGTTTAEELQRARASSTANFLPHLGAELTPALCAEYAVRYWLWLDDIDRWHERAWWFLDSCLGAGITEDELMNLLRANFPDDA